MRQKRWRFACFDRPRACLIGGFCRVLRPDTSSARIQVTPRQTEVYVDGYLAGVVDDFDGFSQRLRVAPGEHVIELYLDGHKTIAQTILFATGQSYRVRHAMEPVAAGEAYGRPVFEWPNANIAVGDDFFITEPQANVMWNISPGQRLVFGLGYRAVANAPLLGDQLNGVSGSVAFQIGGKRRRLRRYPVRCHSTRRTDHDRGARRWASSSPSPSPRSIPAAGSRPARAG